MKIGDSVIFWSHDLEIGTVERVGEYTSSIRESEYSKAMPGYLNKRVKNQEIWPATPANLTLYHEYKTRRKELEQLTGPIHRRMQEIRTLIQAGPTA